ncbi:MAG: hypothetical protein HZB66_00415 [Candidatus Aenigmarchaeota archaeon]|nr:hypothetical protein [Candidatus Aenigmarchaeota archaeon]
MELIIDRYGPVLDTVIGMSGYLEKEHGINVAVGHHPRLVGLALDANQLVYRLHPFTDVIFTDAHGNLLAKKTARRKPGTQPYALRFTIDPDIRYEECDSEDVKYHTILDCGESGKITVRAVENKLPCRPSLFSGLESFLPEKKENITLLFKYMSISPFLIRTSYQDFPMDAEKYPVSLKDRHVLDRYSSHFFRKPIFWDAWSQFLAQEFLELSGHETREEIRERFRNDPAYDRHRSTAIRGCYRLIECQCSGMPYAYEAYLNEIRCPPEYYGFVLSKAFHTLSYIANPDTKESPHVSTLVDRYNSAYAGPNRKRKITVEEIVSKNAFGLQTTFRETRLHH